MSKRKFESPPEHAEEDEQCRQERVRLQRRRDQARHLIVMWRSLSSEDQQKIPAALPYEPVSSFAFKRVSGVWVATLHKSCPARLVHYLLTRYFPQLPECVRDIVCEYVTFMHPRSVEKRKVEERAKIEVARLK